MHAVSTFSNVKVLSYDVDSPLCTSVSSSTLLRLGSQALGDLVSAVGELLAMLGASFATGATALF